MPSTSCLDLLDSTRRAILVALRRLDSATVEEIAARVFLSEGAARQHLQSLQALGLVDYTLERRGPGRPRHRFSITPKAEALFPRLDHEALASLLDALAEENAELRERLVRRLAERAIREYRPTFEREGTGSPLRGVVAVIEETGFMPEVIQVPERATLTLHHCPIAEGVRRRTLLCDVEFRCLAATFPRLGLRRAAFRPSGDPTCAYLLEPGDG